MPDRVLHAFVDNSNVLIEARRFSWMRRKGRNRLSAYTDDRYEIDWGKFLYLLKQQDSRALAHVPILYGSRPPAEDSVWNRIRDDGFDRHWQLPAFESQQILMRPKTIAPAFIADFGP